jgi:hypothetical protein
LSGELLRQAWSARLWKSALRERLYAHLLRLGATYAVVKTAGKLATTATEGWSISSNVSGELARVSRLTKEAERKRRIMAKVPGKEWVGTPLDTTEVDPRNIVEIVVEFDEGEEVLTPKANERFDSYALNEAARYIFFLSNHIQKGGAG